MWVCMCLFVVLQVHGIDAMATRNDLGCGVPLPHAHFSPPPACPAQTTHSPGRGKHSNMRCGLFVVGWGGSTRCGSHFCVANPSHACWSQRQAAVAVFSLSPSSMSRASACHMVSTVHNVCIGSWLMKHIAIRSGTHVFATHNVTHGSPHPDTPSVFRHECTHA